MTCQSSQRASFQDDSYLLHTEYRSCAIGTIAKEEGNKEERVKPTNYSLEFTKHMIDLPSSAFTSSVAHRGSWFGNGRDSIRLPKPNSRADLRYLTSDL